MTTKKSDKSTVFLKKAEKTISREHSRLIACVFQKLIRLSVVPLLLPPLPVPLLP